ncbi:hypothetical protein [Inediibacterium massiliense]|uniref:hypothetical protein n=1 Tax=Inediibacterium massiliense TaxID=1658111 RepID=UPI0006B41096|nr:hypothetical protein [Inediibacterium massiliense]
MNREGFNQFLLESNQEERENLIQAAESLESSYEKSLDEITATEEDAQKFRITLYLDENLTPADKRLFPDVVKLYYEFIHKKPLPPIKARGKGQKQG